MFKGLRYDSTMKSKFDGMLEEFMAFEGIEYQNIADSMEDISEEELMRAARLKLQANLTVVPPVNEPKVPFPKLNEIRLKLNISESLMRRIAVYWELKRQSRCGVPLLRRLLHGKTTSAVAQASEETADLNAYGSLRAHLERIRLLCELVKKREKLKKEYYSQSAKLFDRCMRPLQSIFNDLLDKIENKDFENNLLHLSNLLRKFKVFAKPVSDKDVPGYSSIIKKPMDLSTMRKKVARGCYKQISQMKADFVLMMNNCAKFNRENQYYWKYGIRLNQIGLKYFKVAELENKEAIMSRDLLASISKVAILPTKPEEADDNTDAQSSCSKSSVDIQQIKKFEGVKISKNNSGNKKRTISSSDSPVQKRRKFSELTPVSVSGFCEGSEKGSWIKKSSNFETSSAYGLNASIFTYRNSSRNNPENLTTDQSSAVEESSSADEDFDKRKYKSTRRRFQAQVAPETVEIASDFQHNDIVWVKTIDGRMIGRVIDLRMRIAVDGLPIDDVLKRRPLDCLEPTLVQVFSDPETWEWVEYKSLRHCDLDLSLSDLSPQLLIAATKAQTFLLVRSC
ncbi:unnamed protein product [Dracunculus medinensis]|uniref:Bromo domain-containing protein n=1 Tax=Dracunculus medinensis TaxID=318479 RepID=A0A158Q417_DRAME|nr:unnamed protein product [Dracunculus medinensis]